MEMPLQLSFQTYQQLTPELSKVRKDFGAQNFTIDEIGDSEWEKQVKEWFWKDPDAYVFAYERDELVGMGTFFKREVDFQGVSLKVAGLGGLTVAKEHRGKGIARQLIEHRLKMAKDWGADIAFLDTDIDKLGGLFSQFGFVPLGKSYSFIGKSGQMHEDDSGMVAPILSKEMFKKVLESKEPLFIGESNL